MFDAGINWQRVIQNERVPLLFLAPFLDEAGSLFQAGAALWPGRVRAQQVQSYGLKLAELAYGYRSSGLAWAAGGLYNTDITHMPNATLAMSSCRWKFRLKDSVDVAPQAAPILLAAAVQMTVAVCAELAKRREKATAHALEDELELLSEAPCFGREPIGVPAPAQTHLMNRAIFRACAALARQGGRIHFHSRSDWNRDETPPAGTAELHWNVMASAFERDAQREYLAFARQLPQREVLLGAEDVGYDDSFSISRLYAVEGEIKVADQILRDVIGLLRGGLQTYPANGLPQIEEVVSNLQAAEV